MSNPYAAPRAEIADPDVALRRTVPSSYWAFWKRGWWALFMMTASNVALALLFLPLAVALRDRPVTYLTACAVVALLVGAPLTGWLFEVFASSSARIVSLRPRKARPAPG